MKNILEVLASCEQITEWIDPLDKRLEQGAGNPVPRAGGNLREFWWVETKDDEAKLASEVVRLIIPTHLALKGIARAVFSTKSFGHYLGEGTGNVEIDFTDTEDWKRCFPASRSEIFKTRNGEQTWAAIAVCGNVLGLSVFAQEQAETNTVHARIQLVPEEDFEQLIVTEY